MPLRHQVCASRQRHAVGSELADLRGVETAVEEDLDVRELGQLRDAPIAHAPPFRKRRERSLACNAPP